MSYRIRLSNHLPNVAALSNVLQRFNAQEPVELVAAFEQAVCKATGAAFAVAVNSGTSALHLSLKALGVRSGDTVIVPTFTYVATVNPVLYLGAVPIFVDCEPDTWNMDPALLKKALTDLQRQGRLPRAIVVVHTYGTPALMNELEHVAAFFGVPLLEDAAEAIGARHHGRMAGTLGELGILSFNTNKIVTTFGGGCVLCRTEKTAQKISFWAAQAREDTWYYEHREVGYNYRMNPLAAAYGLGQLPYMEQWVERRRDAFRIYLHHFEKQGAQSPLDRPQTKANRWMSSFWFPRANPALLVMELRRYGIESRPLWKPLHAQPVFKDHTAYLNGEAERLFGGGICLPSYPSVVEEVTRVIRQIIV